MHGIATGRHKNAHVLSGPRPQPELKALREARDGQVIRVRLIVELGLYIDLRGKCAVRSDKMIDFRLMNMGNIGLLFQGITVF